MLSVGSARAGGLLAGVLLDLALRDPARGHPVAAFGRAAGALERRWWADRRSRGAAYAVTCVAAAAALGAVAERAGRRLPGGEALVTAAVAWTVLGGASLAREGERMHRLLSAGDLEGARSRLSHLCGRDPSGLDEQELARATVESLAENASDAVVAPLLWGALLGAPGLAGYRAANTLDAMVGHRTARHLRFGWASARLDDAANLLPARVTALVACLCAPLVGGSSAEAWRLLRRDGGRHPSPNAGRCEAAFAGALGVRLGGVNSYGSRTEVRGPLGDGPAPQAGDIPRAVRLLRLVSAGAALLAAVLAAARAGAGAGAGAAAGTVAGAGVRRARLGWPA